MTKDLTIDALTCRFGDHTALDAVSLHVEAGEFVSILGPSGCGKSTLLRSIAGLEGVQSGSIEIGGRPVQGLAPKERGVAFVFQSYALYPHMTCAANIAAPLTMNRLSTLGRMPFVWRLSGAARRTRAEIGARVAEVADMLAIGPYLNRRPGDLSGGQRQRVALGRALIREPSLFLLDEPLANLDAALRNRTRTELRALQRRIGATTLFVTHDQAEAMAISDRVVVMFDGRIRQVGTPDEMYRNPADLDVARFLSQPHLNVVDAGAVRAQIGEAVGERDILINGAPLRDLTGVVAFRPQEATLRSAGKPGLPGLHCAVEHVEHGGHDANLFVRLTDGTECVVRIESSDIPAWPEGRRGVLHFDLEAARAYAAPDDVGHADIRAVA